MVHQVGQRLEEALKELVLRPAQQRAALRARVDLAVDADAAEQHRDRPKVVVRTDAVDRDPALRQLVVGKMLRRLVREDGRAGEHHEHARVALAARVHLWVHQLHVLARPLDDLDGAVAEGEQLRRRERREVRRAGDEVGVAAHRRLPSLSQQLAQLRAADDGDDATARRAERAPLEPTIVAAAHRRHPAEHRARRVEHLLGRIGARRRALLARRRAHDGQLGLDQHEELGRSRRRILALRVEYRHDRRARGELQSVELREQRGRKRPRQHRRQRAEPLGDAVNAQRVRQRLNERLALLTAVGRVRRQQRRAARPRGGQLAGAAELVDRAPRKRVGRRRVGLCGGGALEVAEPLHHRAPREGFEHRPEARRRLLLHPELVVDDALVGDAELGARNVEVEARQHRRQVRQQPGAVDARPHLHDGARARDVR